MKKVLRSNKAGKLAPTATIMPFLKRRLLCGGKRYLSGKRDWCFHELNGIASKKNLLKLYPVL